jgi:IcmF-related N-terminal domain
LAESRSNREASEAVTAQIANSPATDVVERTADTQVALTTAGGAELVPGSSGPPTQAVPRIRSLDILLSQTGEMETLTRKLKHFCKLLLGDRRPYCPINGILLLLPYAATDSESEARQAGTACHLDLTVIRDSILVNCPVFALLCDIETVPHADRLLEEFSEEQRLQLLGRTFPLVPDLQVSERVRMVETGSDWIGHAAFIPMLYRMMRFSTRDDALVDNIKDNARLFRFFAEMHGRSRRLGRLLGRLISLDTRGQVMLGGCFVACTGRDPKREQGFVGGVLQLLIENQNFVSWTPEAIRQEANYGRLNTLGNIAIAGLAILGLVVIVALWRA